MATEKEDVVSIFIKARDALYEHLSFEEDWVMYPLNFESIDDFWYIRDMEIEWWPDTVDSKDEGNHYYADIYTHRFYPNGSIFRGSEFTMVFGEPRVDGMIWAYVFRNEKEFKR
jgi:hypothetical protein